MGIKTDTEMRKDHEAVRNNVGFYDFTHQMLQVTGKQREEFLDHIFVNSIGDTDPGEATYTSMLNEDGIVLDDVIVIHFSDSEFRITTLAIDNMIEWFDKHSADFKVEYNEITDSNMMYAVQGPKSREVLNEILDEDISDLSWFSITKNKIEEAPANIARAGFTGELGYEIYADPKYKNFLEVRLLEAGEPHGIRKINTAAKLSSLPREKGYVLMSDLDGLNPLEAAMGWSVDWDTDFIGKSALQKAKKEGVKRKLRGFELKEDPDDIKIEPGATVQLNGKDVGKVTAFTYGYTVEKYIGYALVDRENTDFGDEITVDGYEAELTRRVFYDEDNERLTA